MTDASTLSQQAEDASEATKPAPFSSLAPLSALLPFVRPYWRTAVAALVALVLAGAVMLALPYAARLVIDHGFDATEAATLDLYFWLLFGLSALLAVFGTLRYYLVMWLGERVVADLRGAVYEHVLHLDQSFFESRMTGEVLSRLTADTTLVQASAGVNLSITLRSALMFLGGAVMLVITSPKLAGVIALVIPAVLLPLLTFGRRVRRLSRDTQDRIADTSGIAAETLAALPTVQAFTLESVQSERYGAALSQSFEAAVRRIRARSALNAGAVLTVFGAVVFVVWLGAQDVIAGKMTGGELGQFLMYAVMVAGSAASLSEMWGEVQRAAGAMERVMSLLETSPQIDAPEAPHTLPDQGKGEVRFDNVYFSYPTRRQDHALRDFSLQVAPGEFVALVGPSGAGKTTVAQLLVRFYDVDSGSVSVDGVPVDQLEPQSLRQAVALVPQETALFAESAMENIRYGNPDASDEQVIEAARAAHAHTFIEQLPEGYATQLGEHGARLSGGQRQRIAIARALLKRAPILMLDEATSALDAQSEGSVQAALSAVSPRPTTIVIAHRLATVRNADRIVVLNEGGVKETGTHADLIARNGLYARLARTQLLE